MSALLEYYRNREREELARAEATTHEGARQDHLELAAVFRERQTEIEASIRSWKDTMAEVARVVAKAVVLLETAATIRFSAHRLSGARWQL